MINHSLFGFKKLEDFSNFFFKTLLPSNKTYEYFVDWNKVKKSLGKYINEISLMNSLTKLPKDQRVKHLYGILEDYPSTAQIIPILIAERLKKGKIEVFDTDLDKFLTLTFHPQNLNKELIVKFCENTGILSLFEEISDLYDYLLGVEVGMDTNARKNRSGAIFEKMVTYKLNKILDKRYKIIEHDPNLSLYPILLNKKLKKAKNHDIVIYLDKKPIVIIECSFYNTQGSKPISIAESYPKMYKIAKELKINFIWVTDGPAWNNMKEPLLRAMKEMEWVLNFKMLDKIPKILKSMNT